MRFELLTVYLPVSMPYTEDDRSGYLIEIVLDVKRE